MISQTNKAEVLSFSYQEIYLSRTLIQSRNHLKLYINLLAKRFNLPAKKIIFNHDLEDSKTPNEFIDNFKLNGSYDYLRAKNV